MVLAKTIFQALTLVDNFSRECLFIEVEKSLKAEQWERLGDFQRRSSWIRYVESFNESFRDECLNTHLFEDLSDAREKIEA